jgi:hypothetical protein
MIASLPRDSAHTHYAFRLKPGQRRVLIRLDARQIRERERVRKAKERFYQGRQS